MRLLWRIGRRGPHDGSGGGMDFGMEMWFGRKNCVWELFSFGDDVRKMGGSLGQFLHFQDLLVRSRPVQL